MGANAPLPPIRGAAVLFGALFVFATGACTSPSLSGAAGPVTPLTGEIRRDSVNDTIVEWKGDDLSAALDVEEGFRRARGDGRVEEVARAFVTAYAREIRLDNPGEELLLRRVDRDDLGYTHVRFDQRYRGVPIRDAELVVHLGPENQVTRVAGRYSPTPAGVDVTPKVDAAAARKAAATAVDPAADCNNCPITLVLFEQEGQMALAYDVIVNAGLVKRISVLVDAREGKVIRQRSLVPTGAGVGSRESR